MHVVFWGAHPGNRLNTDSTYIRVQRQADDGHWVDIALDRDQNTKFEWERYRIAGSLIKVTWDIPGDARPGNYRIWHNGAAKDIHGTLTDYTGYSRVFSVQ